MEPILELISISKKIEGHQILNNINLNLNPGEIHLVIGENGSGKSTIMKIISGIIKPDSGKILWHGQPVKIESPFEAHQLGVTTIYQEPYLFPKLSITENLFLHKWVKGFPVLKWKELYSSAKKLLIKHGLELDPGKRVANLGLAEKQMIEIIRALTCNSRVLILDEATASLTDPEFEIIKMLLKKITTLGVGVFLVSQRLNDINKIGDRVSVIRDGQVIETREITSISSKKVLSLMAGEPLENRYPKINMEKGRVILEVNNLYSHNILKNINLTLRRGEIVGLAGLMGSGRSLLGKVLFGIEPYSGTIRINNQEISGYTPYQAIKRGVCYVPEERTRKGLFQNLSIKDNIAITQLDRFTKYGIIRKNREIEVIGEYIKNLVIKTKGYQDKAVTLSGGNQQKMVLAKWFNSGSQIFILDEPTRGMDIANKTDVYTIINKLLLSGAAILIISSDLNELVGMCDRIVIVKDGCIIEELDHEQATANKIFEVASV